MDLSSIGIFILSHSRVTFESQLHIILQYLSGNQSKVQEFHYRLKPLIILVFIDISALIHKVIWRQLLR